MKIAITVWLCLMLVSALVSAVRLSIENYPRERRPVTVGQDTVSLVVSLAVVAWLFYLLHKGVV